MNGNLAPPSPTVDDLVRRLESIDLITFRQIAARLRNHQDRLWQFRLLLDLGEFSLKAHAAFVLSYLRDNACQNQKQRENHDKTFRSLKCATLNDWAECIALGKDTEFQNKSQYKFGLEALYGLGFDQCIADFKEIRDRNAHDPTPSHLQLGQKIERLLKTLLTEEGLLSHFLNRTLHFRFGPFAERPVPETEWQDVSIEWNGARFKLLLILIARIEEDIPTGIIAFNECRRFPTFVDYSGNPFPAPPTWIVNELKWWFKEDDSPDFFERIIDSRLDTGDTYYVSRAKTLKTLRHILSQSETKIIWLRGGAGSGKTTIVSQLKCDLTSDFVSNSRVMVLCHFCSVEVPSGASAILSNLHNQFRKLLGSAPDGSSTVKKKAAMPPKNGHTGSKPKHDFEDALREYFGSNQGSISILIDGLDELSDSNQQESIIKTVGELTSRHPLKIIISGGQNLAACFEKTDVPFTPYEAGGFSVDEVRSIVLKLEARISVWTDEDSQMLVERTRGLPIYVHSVLKEIATGIRTRAEILSLPVDVDTYWKGILQCASVERTLDDALGRQKKRINHILETIAKENASLVPSLKDLQNAVHDEFDKTSGRGEKILALYVLASISEPLTAEQLAAILRWDKLIVDDVLRRLVGFMPFNRQSYCLSHDLIAAWLRGLDKGGLLFMEAESRIEKWLSFWRNEPTRTAYLPRFISRAYRQAQAKANVERGALTIRWEALCNDWDFVQWAVENRKIPQLQSVCLELLEDQSLRRLRLAMGKPFLPSDEDVQLLVGRKAYLLQKAESDKDKAKARADGFTLPSEEYGAPGEEMPETIEEIDSGRLLEEQNLQAPIQDDWFKGAQDTADALESITLSFSSSLVGVPRKLAEVNSTGSLREFERFLSASHSALEEISGLSADTAVFGKALAACIRDSGLLKGSKLSDHARGILAQEAGPCLRRINPDRKFQSSGGVFPMAFDHPFEVAACAPLLAYAQRARRRPNQIPTLVLWNWLENREERRRVFPDAEKIEIQALRADGQETITIVDGVLQRLDWFSSAPDVVGQGDAKLVAITPDFSHAIFSVEDGEVSEALGELRYQYIDLKRNECHPESVRGQQLLGARISDGGAFYIYGKYFHLYLWTPEEEFLLPRLGLPFAVQKLFASKGKPRNFVLSSSGRFLHFAGHVYSLEDGMLIRRFEEISEDAVTAFSSDSRMLAALEPSGKLLVFDVQSGQVIRRISCRAGGEKHSVTPSLMFTQDGRFVMVRHGDYTFSVIDLFFSVSSDASIEAERLSLQGGYTLIPAAFGLRQVAAVEGISRNQPRNERLSEILQWQVLPVEGALLAKSEVEEEERQYRSGTPLCDVEVLWVPREGFRIDAVCKSSGRRQSRMDLVSTHKEIDWESVCTFPTWDHSHKSEEGETAESYIRQIGWNIVCGRPYFPDEAIGSVYPSILIHLSLVGPRIIKIRNTASFEFGSESYGISRRWMVLSDQGSCRMALWDLEKDSWEMFSLENTPGFKPHHRIDRCIPFDWLQRVVVLDQYRGLIGWVDVAEKVFKATDSVNNKLSTMPAYGLENTSFMVGVITPRDDDVSNHFGLCLMDPFKGHFLSHIYFEQEIIEFRRISETLFCLVFKDGSVEEVAVDGINLQGCIPHDE